MDFLELAKKRYSVRKYEAKKVEDDKLALILEAGRIAPTAANIQPQRLLVIQSEEGFKKLTKAANLHGAPLAIIVCGDHNNVWIRPHDGKNMVDIDASIVTDHMMMQAEQLGLGTCWLTYFDPKIIRTEFNLPENIEPVNILVMGYASGQVESPERHAATRKKLNEILFYETF